MSLIQQKQRQPMTASTIRGFRADIQGLRAIAVAAVVLYHFWPHRLPGGFIGVDVFFVISGFLITAHLIKAPPQGLKQVISFWMRRVKRLLPASFLVILLSVLGIWLLAPETVWQDWGIQALAATFYMQNWYLATSKVDYMAEADAPSPFQHFWSLAVEEQFYFVWPVLIGVVAFVALKRRIPLRTAVLGAVGVIFLGSLVFSVLQTNEDAGIAYFSTFTRAWEFAVGALVAALGTRAVAPKADALSAVASWVGLAAIFGSALLFTGELPFPGYIALLPVLGTALVILSHGTHPYSPARFLAWGPMRVLGDHSYALYLWHWPLLVLAPYLFADFKAVQKIGLLLLAFVLSVLTQRLVETRFRKYLDSPAWLSAPRFLAVGSLCLALTAGGFNAVAQHNISSVQDVRASVTEVKKDLGVRCFAANGLSSEDCLEATEGLDELAPAPVVAKNDKPDAYADDCFASQTTDFSERPVCNYGKGKTKVALVGNSHAGHWLPAVQIMADRNDWSVDTYVASRCAVMDEEQDFESEAKTEGCAEYEDWVTKQFREKGYDLIITSNRQSLPVEGHSLDGSEKPAEEAYKQTLKDWKATGAKIMVIRDTPWPGKTMKNVPDCVAAADEKAVKKCSADRDTWEPMDPQYQAVAALKDPDIGRVNLNDAFCTDETCYSVIGGVIAYFDHSHLSETFSASLSGKLEKRMREELPDASLWVR
ncbi:acyltransferase family protein [Glutamicibacter sp. X7]